MVGLPWEQHVDFLASRARARSIEDRVRAAVAVCAGHPAVLCYAIGNEIPTRVVRGWAGRLRVQRATPPAARRTPADFSPTSTTPRPNTSGRRRPTSSPTTSTSRRPGLERYLARVQNLAGDRPLLMAELGLDSRAHGNTPAAEVLDWQQVRLRVGLCGRLRVLVDRRMARLVPVGEGDANAASRSRLGLRPDRPRAEGQKRRWGRCAMRSRKPFEVTAAGRGYRSSSAPTTAPARWDAASGGRSLDYPDFEVIVVDDGSTDDSAEIAPARVPAHLYREPWPRECAEHGLRAADGEIVAYLDDDAHPDPHWLRYLAHVEEEALRAPADRTSRHPRTGPWPAASRRPPVGRSTSCSPIARPSTCPGATWLSGARRSSSSAASTRSSTWRETTSTSAGGCWRPGTGSDTARRPSCGTRRASVRAYLRQQRGYGAAEALLERKWPHRYGPAGRARWRAVSTAADVSGIGRGRVYYGTWGSEPFQAL